MNPIFPSAPLRMLPMLLVGMLCFTACNKNEVLHAEEPPVITLDSETGVYTVKAGRELRIAPAYGHAEGALYRWSIDGRTIGEEPVLTFRSETTGSVYILLQVTTPRGKAEEELRVEVVDPEIPTVSLAGADEGFTILCDAELPLEPLVAEGSLTNRFRWSVDGREVSTERRYTFRRAEAGSYALRFAASNEDGEDAVEFVVRVCTADELPVRWHFEQTDYRLALGRTIRLMPLDLENADGARYTWSVGGTVVQEGPDPAYRFTGTAEGRFEAVVTMRRNGTELTQPLHVEVCPPEGRYRRPRTADAKADANRVYAFLPAPGQFVNERYAAATPAEACAYAEGQLARGGIVSLGGFGGTLVMGFDHSIDNSGDYDFAVCGNSFADSSEPGIVWVMQDENGDGLPNDTWYELRGSETGKPETQQDYAVTYYRPRGPRMAVEWTDNRGNHGTIDYRAAFHDQECYYPAWVEGTRYTLRGTCLGARNHDQSGDGSYWINAAYDWGYADNFSPIDRLTDAPNPDAGANANHFKISNAVDCDGRPVALQYIDFVKVQTGVNAKSGSLGEISTEVLGCYDYHMKRP